MKKDLNEIKVKVSVEIVGKEGYDTCTIGKYAHEEHAASLETALATMRATIKAAREAVALQTSETIEAREVKAEAELREANGR